MPPAGKEPPRLAVALRPARCHPNSPAPAARACRLSHNTHATPLLFLTPPLFPTPPLFSTCRPGARVRHPRALRRAARRARCGRAHADAHGAAAWSDAWPRQPQNERWPSTAHGAKGRGGPRGAEAELLGSGQARVRARAQAQGRIRGSGAEVRPRGPRSAALSACRAPCTVASRQGTMAAP